MLLRSERMTSKEIYYKGMKVKSFKLTAETFIGEGNELIAIYSVTWFRPNGQDTFRITKEEYETLLDELKRNQLEEWIDEKHGSIT